MINISSVALIITVNIDCCKPRAVGKRTVAYCRDAVRDCYACKPLAVVKRIFAYCRTIFFFIFLFPCCFWNVHSLFHYILSSGFWEFCDNIFPKSTKCIIMKIVSTANLSTLYKNAIHRKSVFPVSGADGGVL